MKKYTMSLTLTYTSDDFDDEGLGHLTDSEIREYMEERFDELLQSNVFINTDFLVEEI